MVQVFLSVALAAAGIINLLRSPQGAWKTPAYDVLGSDVVSQGLARPRLYQYRCSSSLLMMVVEVARLIEAVGK